ncbi:MAG: FAD:protein FMN transferase [Oscillospiraceae bacterium]|nr:FAD:protein FMN transferase [Oscillospiraceae bacterium]
MRQLKKIIPLLLCAALLLSGCGVQEQETEPSAADQEDSGEQEKYSGQVFAMDTYMSVDVYSDSQEPVDQAISRIQELEALFSTTDESSEIYAINANGSGTVSGDVAYVLSQALELCALTGGALDISIYPVVRAWGFTTGEYRIPSESELTALLEHVDYTAVSLEDGAVTLGEDMMIDLGSVVKGYTGDVLTAQLAESGVTSALLNLGGNVQALGTKPDGSLWRVAIQDPNDSEGYLGVVSVADKAVVTSGGYERYFQGDDGEIYWHIIDPSTGAPAQNGLGSVSIIGDSGLYCDALSTALFIMGEEQAVAFWRERQDFEMVLVTDDGRLLVSAGLEDCFESMDIYSMEVIEP